MTAGKPLTGAVFLDTNVFCYAFDDRFPAKQVRARELVRRFVARTDSWTSIQVAQEFLNVVTTRFNPAVPREHAREILQLWSSPNVVSLSLADVIAAADLKHHAQLSLWDALIVIAAHNSGCSILYTEDLQSGRVIDGLQIVNPFA